MMQLSAKLEKVSHKKTPRLISLEMIFMHEHDGTKSEINLI
jgi:hypothetical protein